MVKENENPLERKRLYVLVADNSQARLFESHTPARDLNEIMTQPHEEGRLKESERYSDRPGSDHGGVGAYQSYDRERPEDPEQERFARDLGKRLDKARHEGRFDNLVLIAPPAFLGTLRRHLSKDCLAMVVKSISKDVVRLEPAAIAKHLDV